MKTRIPKIIILTVCAIALLGAISARATLYTSTGGGGNWNLTTTWNPAGVPGAGDIAAIAAADPVTVSDTEAAGDITIQKGANLYVGTGGILTVSTNITQSGGTSGTAVLSLTNGTGTLNLSSATTLFTSVLLTNGTAGATVNYTAAGATVYGFAYDNLTLTGGGTVAVGNNTTAINLTLSNGTAVSINSNNKALASISGNVTVNDTSAFTIPSNNSGTIGGSVTENGSSIITLGASTTVGGNFAVNNTARYTNNNGNAVLTIAGSVSVASGASWGISGNGNVFGLTLTGSSQTISGGGTLLCQVVNITGSYTLAAGTTLSEGTVNAGSGLLEGTGSLVNQGTLVLNYSGTYASAAPISSLNCSATGNTLQLNEGNGGATTLPTAAFYNIVYNANGGADSLNLGNVTSIANLTIGGSTGPSSLVTAWPGAGIPGEVTMNSTKGITFPNTSFSIEGFNQSAGTATVPANGNLMVTGTGASAWTRTGGTLNTAAGSTVSFTGTIPIIGGSVGNNFANLSIATGTTATNLEPLVVTNTLSVSSGGVLDVTALSTYTLAPTQTVVNASTLVGNLATASNSKVKIYAETDDIYSTNTIAGSLAFSGNDSVNLNINSTAPGPNDLLAVGGALTLNNTTFNLSAPSAGATIDTNNYILATAQSITGTPMLNWVVAPAGAANYSVVVQGTNVVLTYTVPSVLPPSISSIVPSFGSTNGGTLVTINGANFLSNPQVTFGALSANNITYVNSSEITVTTPAQSPGPVTVTVTDTDSQMATGGYSYVLPPPPAQGTVASFGANSETVVWTGGTNENCVLLSSTNILGPWTPMVTNSVGASGLSTNVITVNPNQPQMFYDLGIPYN